MMHQPIIYVAWIFENHGTVGSNYSVQVLSSIEVCQVESKAFLTQKEVVEMDKNAIVKM